MISFREKIHKIVFDSDSLAGRIFDLGLIISIILSVVNDMLETVDTLYKAHTGLFDFLDWFFTIIFSVELILRLYSAKKWQSYLFSFYGMIDFISVTPSYLTFLFPSLGSLAIIRSIRIIRIFRILKLSRYTDASKSLSEGLSASRPKIIVFLFANIMVVCFMGALMYLIEGGENGFTSIPKSIYWAVVTLTTVGYGDMVPHTILGKAISSLLMIVGYGIIAVPTGVVSADIVRKQIKNDKTKEDEKNDKTNNYCPKCGHKLR